MSTLQVANIAFETTDNNQIVYVSNTVNVTIGGANDVMSSNSSTVILKFANVVSNNFSVSATTFDFATNAAIKTLNTNGALIFSGNVSPTQLTVDTASWNPGIGNSYLVRMSSNGAITLYGLVAGSNGQVIVLNNIGSGTITLNAEDAANESTAANRFQLPDNTTLFPFSSISLIYDGIAQRWRTQNSLGTPFIFKATTKGFFGGGLAPNETANVNRVTYATETTASVAGAALSQARAGLGAAGNACKGFFMGGINPFDRATADRTTYSSETTAAVPTANLTQARNSPRGAGNDSKAFFVGGGPCGATSIACRTTYSTEATAAVSGANLTVNKTDHASTGNACKGFFTGGESAAFTPSAVTNRTTYSTEATAAVTGANLSQARTGFSGGTGNSCKGFVGGAYTPATPTLVDRITYSTETTAAVPGAALSQARAGVATSGDASKGFFGGGFVAPTPVVATTDRLTYSTETTVAVPGANMTTARGFHAGM